MRLTVGPLPPAVYWRRRAFVLGAILLVLFLVAQACMAASASPEDEGDTNGAAASPSPSSSPSPSPSPTTPSFPSLFPSPAPSGTAVEISEEQRCADDEMRVTAEAEQTTFAVGTNVQFTIRIQNAADRVCVRDVGPSQRELYLRPANGAGRLWSSRDCTGLSGSEVRELPRDFESAHWIVWNGRASDVCDGTEPGGELLEPGEYELVARLGTAYSEPVAITLR
jgi:hypothetical protein